MKLKGNNMTKIPHKFLQQYSHLEHCVQEVYINVNNIMVFTVNKQVYNDKLQYSVQIIMNNNYTVPLKYDMDEKLFQEFILWANKELAFANIVERG